MIERTHFVGGPVARDDEQQRQFVHIDVAQRPRRHVVEVARHRVQQSAKQNGGKNHTKVAGKPVNTSRICRAKGGKPNETLVKLGKTQ